MSNIVRKYDFDRHLATLFCKKSQIDDIFKFLEFNTEVALIRSKVTDPAMGMVRLRWWEDQIEKIYNDQPIEDNNILALSLRGIILKYQIDKQDILSITSNIQSDLENIPFQSKSEFYAYVYNTSFIPLKIISQINGSSEFISGGNSDIFVLMAKKWGISAIFRAAMRNIGKGRIVLPIDLVEKYQLKPDRINSPNFKIAFAAICNDILADITEERNAIGTIDKRDLKLMTEHNPHFFILNKIADIYFKKFKDYDCLVKQQNIPLGVVDLLKISVGYKSF